MKNPNGHCSSMTRAFLALTLLFLAVTLAGAQTFRGTILGTVTDASGANVPGATVTAHNTDTGLARTTETQADGSYRIPELPTGTYDVTIEKGGFRSSLTKDV